MKYTLLGGCDTNLRNSHRLILHYEWQEAKKSSFLDSETDFLGFYSRQFTARKSRSGNYFINYIF